MVLLALVTAGASALLDNVTTVLLVVPVTLLVCERLGLQPPAVPDGRSPGVQHRRRGDPPKLLVGDPPNIIIASRAEDLTFTDFLVHMLPVVLVVLAAFLVLIRVMFRKSLAKPVTGVDALMALDEREAIKDPRLLLRSGIVLGAILIGFLLQRQTGISPSVVALVGAGIMILISPARPGELVEDVEWETLLFFIGLFILVGALVEVGALEQLAQFMANVRLTRRWSRSKE